MTKSTNLDALRKTLHGTKFTGGWTKAMTGGAVEFDKAGLNILSVPVMVQWRGKDLVTVWPDSFAKSKPVWKL
jgi:branched-chain amino acid transport system substrate-binding protein